jgi:Domain of unknown function (DUF4136)
VLAAGDLLVSAGQATKRAHRYLRSYSSWNRPFYDDVWTRRYLEGTLTVDVVERDTGRLLYRAEVNNEIGDNLEKYVAKSVDRAFKKFPVKELGN